MQVQTFTGQLYDLRVPDLTTISLDDIAHALAQICRFTGATRGFYCPTPEQRILTADLQWKPAGELRVGDALLGFDEYPHELGSSGQKRRRYRPSYVTHTQDVKRRVVRLELEDGSTIRASEEHPWLVATRQGGNQSWRTVREIAEDLKCGRPRYMQRFFTPWSTAQTWDAGWLAGLFDGEGYLSVADRKGTLLGVSQRPGLILTKAQELLAAYGVDSLYYGPSGVKGGDVVTLQVRGGWREQARLLGTIRPVRLLETFQAALRSGAFGKQMEGRGAPLRVVRAYEEGPQWVSGLETSTHTYFCEGFGAHNSVAQHSVVCSFLVAPEYALDALLHDAPEAYVGDRSSPVGLVYRWARNYGTEHPWADPHQQMHFRAMIAIYYALDLVIPEHAALRAVQEADYTALRHEATVHLTGGPAIEPETGAPWCEPLAIEPTTLIHPWASGKFEKDSGGLAASLLYGSIPPAQAKQLFLARLLELAQGPHGNPALEKKALDSYHRPPLEPLSYRKIRQAFGGHDGRDPDDIPGPIL